MQERDNTEETTTADMVTSMLYMAYKKEGFKDPTPMKLFGTGGAFKKERRATQSRVVVV